LLQAGQSDLNPCGGQEIFSFPYLSGPALGPTQQGNIPLSWEYSSAGADDPSQSSALIKNQ